MTSNAYVQVHTKTLCHERNSNTLIELLIRNHKLRTGSETFMNPVKLFNVFLQVKINTFLPIHEKNIFCFPHFMHYTHFFMFFSLSLIVFFILTKLATLIAMKVEEKTLALIYPTVPKYIVISFNYQL